MSLQLDLTNSHFHSENSLVLGNMQMPVAVVPVKMHGASLKWSPNVPHSYKIN